MDRYDRYETFSVKTVNVNSLTSLFVRGLRIEQHSMDDSGDPMAPESESNSAPMPMHDICDDSDTQRAVSVLKHSTDVLRRQLRQEQQRGSRKLQHACTELEEAQVAWGATLHSSTTHTQRALSTCKEQLMHVQHALRHQESEAQRAQQALRLAQQEVGQHLARSSMTHHHRFVTSEPSCMLQCSTSRTSRLRTPTTPMQ